jgi:hypothetical protein
MIQSGSASLKPLPRKYFIILRDTTPNIPDCKFCNELNNNYIKVSTDKTMTEIKTEKSLESTVKSLSLVYLLLIISGLCYRYFFYKNFGVVITEYIDLNEALLIFLPLLGDSFGFVFIITIFMSFSFKEVFRKNLFKSASQKEKLNVVFGLGIVILIVTGIISFFTKNIDTFYSGLVSVIIFCVPLFIDMLIGELQLNFPKLIRESIYVLIVVLTIIIWRTYNASRIINDKLHLKRFEIVFKEQNKILKSDSTYYYLGRTKNFIFIYDFKYKCSRVFNVSDVKEFIMTK